MIRVAALSMPPILALSGHKAYRIGRVNNEIESNASEGLLSGVRTVTLGN